MVMSGIITGELLIVTRFRVKNENIMHILRIQKGLAQNYIFII